MAWWIVVGLACIWLLLEVFRLRSPALRYPLTAVVMRRLMSNSEGVILANRTHQFVFDRATERGMLPHRSPSESAPTILRETLGRGVTFLAFSAAPP